MFFIRVYLDSYSGRRSTLKQVWAVGRFLVLEWRWIVNFRDLRPSMGTLSVPVMKVRKFFFCYWSRVCRNSQKCLCKRGVTR